VWTNVLQQLKKDLSETTITTWFDELTAVDIRENTFYLHCPNDFKKRYIESLFIKNIKAALQDLFSMEFEVKILDEAGYTDTDGDGIREKDGVKLSASFMYQTGSASDDNLVVYICDQASKIGIELTPQSAQMMDWYAMVQSGEYGLTIFKTQGGYYDPASVVTNINPATSMDPILMQIGVSQPEIAALVDELDSSADEARIQEIYSTILTTMADQCLTTPLIYTRQLTVYSDTVSSYTFPTDASFTSVQNIHLK